MGKVVFNIASARPLKELTRESTFIWRLSSYTPHKINNDPNPKSQTNFTFTCSLAAPISAAILVIFSACEVEGDPILVMSSQNLSLALIEVKGS